MSFLFRTRLRCNTPLFARSFRTSNTLTASLRVLQTPLSIPPSRPPLPSPLIPRHGLFPKSTLSPILQFIRTDLRNATHRDVYRSRGSGSSWRRPPRHDWLDSLDSNVILWGIIAVNAGVFLVWQLAIITYQGSRDSTLLTFMMNNFRVNVSNVMSGRIWTLVTSCFSHMETSHLLLNTLSFYFMAPAVMQLLGNKQFLALYLLGGICSCLASIAWNRFYKHENISSLGASGATLATVALYACAFPRNTFLIFFIIPCPAWAFLPGILCYDIWQSISDKRNNNVDTAGHVGGMLYGIGYFLRRIALRR